MEDGHTIELLSIGLVDRRGNYYEAANIEADQSKANDWVKSNVLPHLPPVGDPRWKTRAQIREDILHFIPPKAGRPRFWTYFGSYDWVVFCQLFGKMIDLPLHFPKYTMDLKQLSTEKGDPIHPPQTGTQHNALSDACWNRELHLYLERLR